MVTVSYAILVNDELEEIKTLTDFLIRNKRNNDEIVVLQDLDENTKCSGKKKEAGAYLITLEKDELITFGQRLLNNDFASQKNYLTSLCTKDYIFNIDADEMPTRTLMANLHEIIELNDDAEMLLVPRINKVDGIKYRHIQQGHGSVDAEDRINGPDGQARIYKNDDNIKGIRPVHEYLLGFTKFAHLPDVTDFALKHFKKIDKQEKQNDMYQNIIQNKQERLDKYNV